MRTRTFISHMLTRTFISQVSQLLDLVTYIYIYQRDLALRAHNGHDDDGLEHLQVTNQTSHEPNKSPPYRWYYASPQNLAPPATDRILRHAPTLLLFLLLSLILLLLFLLCLTTTTTTQPAKSPLLLLPLLLLRSSRSFLQGTDSLKQPTEAQILHSLPLSPSPHLCGDPKSHEPNTSRTISSPPRRPEQGSGLAGLCSRAPTQR